MSGRAPGRRSTWRRPAWAAWTSAGTSWRARTATSRAEGCDREGLTLPVTEYGHDLGCSVTGGTVYRGTAWPALAGFYVFADYCSGRFWAIPADAQPTVEPVVVLESDRSISAIAERRGRRAGGHRPAAGELLRISAPGR